jgi:hypothetical protein
MIVLPLIAISVWFLVPNNKARIRAEQAHRILRQEGFKLDLNEFQLSSPAGIGADNELLTLAGDASRNSFSIRRLDLMRPVNSNSAMVIWTQESPISDSISDTFWPDLRQTLAERNAVLDRACESVLSGPFRFRTTFTTNGDIASDVFRARLIASSFAARTILELHDQHLPTAWTNLLALTRFVTAWQTEPTEISHITQSRWVTTAQRVTWEALQSKDWTESQLATLQREWESANFFNGLPETAALSRASIIAFCDAQRQKPPPPGPTLRQFIYDLVSSPGRARDAATSGWRSARYRNYESYEDETAWLLYYRDCELDYRRALAANSWSDLRNLPSATNSRPAKASNSVLGIEALRNMGRVFMAAISGRVPPCSPELPKPKRDGGCLSPPLRLSAFIVPITVILIRFQNSCRSSSNPRPEILWMANPFVIAAPKMTGSSSTRLASMARTTRANSWRNLVLLQSVAGLAALKDPTSSGLSRPHRPKCRPLPT